MSKIQKVDAGAKGLFSRLIYVSSIPNTPATPPGGTVGHAVAVRGVRSQWSGSPFGPATYSRATCGLGRFRVAGGRVPKGASCRPQVYLHRSSSASHGAFVASKLTWIKVGRAERNRAMFRAPSLALLTSITKVAGQLSAQADGNLGRSAAAPSGKQSWDPCYPGRRLSAAHAGLRRSRRPSPQPMTSASRKFEIMLTARWCRTRGRATARVRSLYSCPEARTPAYPCVGETEFRTLVHPSKS